MTVPETIGEELIERSCLASKAVSGFVIFYRDPSETGRFMFSFELHDSEGTEMGPVRECICQHMVDALSLADETAGFAFQGGIGCISDGRLRLTPLTREQVVRLIV